MKLIEALCQAELALMAEARRSISSVKATEVQKDDIIRIGKKQEAKL